MKISTRVLLTNLGFLVIILLMSGVSVFQLLTLDRVSSKSSAMAEALRNQMQADMMHDGLRADVLYALNVAAGGDPKARQEAIASTAEHVSVFSDSIAKVKSLNISNDVNTSLEKLKEPLENYTKSAADITRLSFKNLALAQAQYPSFEKDFEYLEAAMGDFGDVVQAEFDISKSQIKAEEKRTKMIIAGTVFASLLFAVSAWLSMRSDVVKPLISMQKSMVALSSGDLSVEIPASNKKNEIGLMAGSLEVFKNNALETKKMREEHEAREIQASQDKKRIMKDLANQFDAQVGGSIQSLALAAEKLQQASKEMEATAKITQDASSSVAAASEETSSNVSTVASATEEMTSSSQEISKQVSDVASKASEASDSAQRTSSQVNELNTLVSNIGVVVTAIKDIAEQTNLLALNATIEAARAGDAGKGFAVVADEVKKLATETAKKTEEIESRIAEIQKATEASVQAVQIIIKNIADIDGLSARAAGAVEEQNVTIAEITRNISEVSSASRDVANVIGQVQQGASDVGKSAEMLRGSADNIASLSDNLENAVSGFLDKIRTDGV